MIAADTHGNICFQVSGLVPKRSNDLSGKGLFPVRGTEGKHAWVGWLEHSELPTVGPEEAEAIHHGLLANANQKIDLNGASHIGGEWDRPYRYQRIRELLTTKELHDASTFKAMQYDTLSLEAVHLLPALIHLPISEKRASDAYRYLKNFNGDMRDDSVAALIYSAWMDEFARAVIGKRIGAAQLGSLYGRRLFRPALEQILLNPTAMSQWCDSPRCMRELSDSFALAVDRLAAAYGPQISSWRWGEAHFVQLQDDPIGKASESRRYRRLAVSGDPSTINMTHYEPSASAAFPAIVGPNARLVHDLSDRNASWFVHLGGLGESADFEEARMASTDWMDGRYRELRFEPRKWVSDFFILPRS